jgi:16S rRNA (guanine966-N2)-methyltransferase
MRIIAGSAGGIHLKVPSHHLRPTMDRVRGAIFSSIGDLVIDANVLDLFAGSGGYGIEALSRGAASTVFVDQHTLAATTIRENLSKTHLQGTVHREDVFHFLRRTQEVFTLIFADPPYADSASILQLLTIPSLKSILAENGLLIIESAKPLPNAPDWEPLKQKKYGNTVVTFFASK